MKSAETLCFGTNGQISRCLADIAPEYKFISREECDFSNLDQIVPVLNKYKPKVVINPAAYTDVNAAESNREIAFNVNSLAPQVIAKWCKSNSALLIHFSTDYVYQGEGNEPQSESAALGPLNVYGESKLHGENKIIGENCDYIILRTSWVFSPYSKNFVRTILRLSKEKSVLPIVSDQFGSPTYAGDLAKLCFKLAKSKESVKMGIYNVSNAGYCSWAEFAKAILKIGCEEMNIGCDCEIDPIKTADYATPAKRPLNSRLNTLKLERELQFIMPRWEESVAKCIRLIKEAS